MTTNIDRGRKLYGKAKGGSRASSLRRGVTVGASSGGYVSVLLDGSDEPVTLACGVDLDAGQSVSVMNDGGTYKIIGGGEGSGAGFAETDPTVPAWAKQPTKPTYTAKEVGALPASTVIPTRVGQLENDKGYALARLAASLIPDGTEIPSPADLNTAAYLKVGNYFCRRDDFVQMLTNCPCSDAFMMQVYSPLSTTIDNEDSAFIYRIRKIMTWRGDEYVQQCNTNGSAGVWTFGAWEKVSRGDCMPKSGGTFTGGISGTSLSLTGNINANWVTAKWLRATEAENAASNTGKIAVLDSNGWVYYRTPAQVLSDIGGAKLGSPNNLVHNSNEVTMVPDAYSGILHFNYRTASGEQNGSIEEYHFDNGHGGTDGVTLVADRFSGRAATAHTASAIVAANDLEAVTAGFKPNGGSFDFEVLAANARFYVGEMYIGNEPVATRGWVSAQIANSGGGGGGGGSALPVGYTQVDYIRSNGTQYIDTGFTPNQNTRVVMECEVTSADNGTSMTALFGVRDNDGASRGFAVFVRPAFDILYHQHSGNYGNVSCNMQGWLIVEKNRNQVFVDGNHVSTFNDESFTSSATLTLFAAHEPGDVKVHYTAGKIRSCKIYDNGTLIRDYIPCRNASGAVGLYDLANSRFYTSAGSGSFVAGPNEETLYSNTSGTTGTITLPRSAADFAFLEIQYTDGSNRYQTARVYFPNGKSVAIDRTVSNGSATYYCSSVLTINGTSITQGNQYQTVLNGNDTADINTGSLLKITQVIGWK